MKPRALLWLVCLAPAALLAFARAPRSPLAAPRDLATAFPDATILFVELGGGDRLWRELHGKWWPRIEASPIAPALYANPEFVGWLAGLSAFALGAGHTAEAALLNLLGREAAFGVIPRAGGARPESLLLMRATDPALARRSIKALAQLMKRPLPATADGAPLLLTLDQGACLAIVDDLVVVASDDAALDHLQERLHGRDPSLLSNPGFATARARSSEGRVAFLWLNSAALDALTPAPGLVPEGSQNPIGQLLAGRLLCALNHSSMVSAELCLSGRELRVDVELPCDLEARSPLKPVYREAPHSSAPLVPDTLLSISARRDYRAWWDLRDAVLDERLKPGLVEFETNMGVLFSGKSVGDVLAGLDGDTHFVLTRQEFGEHGPTVRYPAGALVLKVADAKALWPHLLIAFQTAIGFANADRGQKGLAQLLIENGAYRDCPIVTTRYVDDMTVGRAAGNAPEHANVRPACAMANGELILASSVDLARQVVDAIVDDRRLPRTEMLDTVTLQARSLVKILAENEAALVANSMLEKGLSKVAAKQQLDVLLQVVRLFESAGITTREQNGALTVSARLRWNPLEVAAR